MDWAVLFISMFSVAQESILSSVSSAEVPAASAYLRLVNDKLFVAGARGAIAMVDVGSGLTSRIGATTDGSFAAVSASSLLVYKRNRGQIELTDLDGKRGDFAQKGSKGFVYCPESRVLAYLTPRNVVELYSLAERKVIGAWNTEESLVSRLGDFSEGGRLLVSKRFGRHYVWDPPYSREPYRLECGGYVVGSCFSKDGSLLALGTDENIIHVIHVSSKKVVASLGKRIREGRVRALEFTWDRKFLISGNSHGELVVWETKDYREVGRVKAHEGTVYQVRCAGDGRTVLSTGDDELLRKWIMKVVP